MRISSLRFRLILLSVVSILLALAATTFVLNTLFHQFFQERIFAELDQDLKQLTANISINDDGTLTVSPLQDPRFAEPFSGLYWQIVEEDHTTLSSTSLWGTVYETSMGDEPGKQYRVDTTSGQGVPILVLGWTIILGDDQNQRKVTLSIATNESEVIEATTRFRTSFIQWLFVMFIALIIASTVQVLLGLAPLETLRRKVGQVRAGTESRLNGQFPREVQPLADEVNELLELHETSLEDARARASDLAHGLKTPLTVMLMLAQDMRRNEQVETAAEIESQVASMHHFIERELARTRTRTPTRIQTPALPVAEKMVSAIRKFPRDTPLDWEMDIPADLTTPFDEHDLSELLGNIFDNARKWAKGKVTITGLVSETAMSSLCIEDDGPGVPDALLQTILTRGGRLDADVQGTGLGLTICADMTESYGATLTLTRAKIGGLAVCISWPHNYR